MESITAFRARVRALLEAEAGAARPCDVAILALDGIPYDLARSAWTQARTEPMRSVFPTTSATGWLSSLTGADVGAHGVPGVVFRVAEDGRPVDVFAHRGPLGGRDDGNVFADAAALGWEPLAVVGDLEPFDCAWRDLLLLGARRVEGHRFFTASGAPDAAALCARLRAALAACLPGDGRPRLVWCFVDVDRHVHRHGYDGCVLELLAGIERIAAELAERGTVVLAHADHGLVPTRTDPALERLLASLERRGCAIGGAGRVRWVYPRARAGADALRRELAASLPPSVRVAGADELFAPGTLARRRVGDVVLVAEGERFLTSPGYRYDHGSLSRDELEVPCSAWRG